MDYIQVEYGHFEEYIDWLNSTWKPTMEAYKKAGLIAYVSQVMTLLPGDVLLTGTPAGVGPLTDGDEVSVTIESIGTLTNRVVIGD